VRITTLFALVAGVAACAPGDGIGFQVINMERPPEGAGLAPPNDYTPCYTGEARGYDTNGDGRVDRIAVTVNGKPRCYGEDSNHDGVIDTWDLMDESGRISRRAHDSDGDRRVDQSWTFDPSLHGCASLALDRDGDGLIDPGDPIHICRQLGGAPQLPPRPATDAGH
jgi:hypothetical protein